MRFSIGPAMVATYLHTRPVANADTIGTHSAIEDA